MVAISFRARQFIDDHYLNWTRKLREREKRWRLWELTWIAFSDIGKLMQNFINSDVILLLPFNIFIVV
jgi:hypothetical protein